MGYWAWGTSPKMTSTAAPLLSVTSCMDVLEVAHSPHTGETFKQGSSLFTNKAPLGSPDGLLHAGLPLAGNAWKSTGRFDIGLPYWSSRHRSEEHTSELPSQSNI